MPRARPSVANAERICWEHRELLDAIRDRDVERARAMIRLQIRPTLDMPIAATPASHPNTHATPGTQP
jgi:DNA-binding GntR family transcriptional regulator